MKSIYKFLICLYIIVILIANCLSVYSLAVQEVTVEYKEDCGQLIKRDGVIRTISYTVVNNNGIESPVYCLDKNKPGVGEAGEYIVSRNSVLKDAKVWRVIKNGFPYKTLQELGCENNKEAFAATKMAVYSAIYGYSIEDFEALDTDESRRTYQALQLILENAEKSTEYPTSSTLTIEDTENWKQDENNKENVYKILSVKNYIVNIIGEAPEGVKITDINNHAKTDFDGSENFKISIPIKELKDNGQINIQVEGKVKTNPVYIGESTNPDNQDYAITQIETENGIGEKVLRYSANKTKIKIIKKDEEGNTLKNAVFELLDENKNIIKTNLATNEQGEIDIENVQPGQYYVKEIVAPAGYQNLDRSIEINVKFNEELSVIVRNQKEEQPTVEIERNELEFSNIVEKVEKTEVVKLPKTGM